VWAEEEEATTDSVEAKAVERGLPVAEVSEEGMAGRMVRAHTLESADREVEATAPAAMGRVAEEETVQATRAAAAAAAAATETAAATRVGAT